MKNNLYTIVYSLVMGTVCALLLTAGGLFTDPYRQANAQAELTRNVLKVLGISFSPQASSGELLALYQKTVERVEHADLEIYRTKQIPEIPQMYAVALSGQGLWGPIEGFLALEADMETIRGITFHKQEETPGLGGEIGSDKFQSGFSGKRIIDRNGNAGIKILRSKATAINEIDGITGATMTCDKVEALINTTIRKIRNAARETSNG